jgi:RNA polymerase sigma-70 factor (ECF subfamily)
MELGAGIALITGVTPSDAEVIAASCRDPEQFASLFDRHAPHIHRYLARRVGPLAADDLVAETFLAAFGQRGRYDPSYDNARPWLYGIATNLLGQFRREEVRRLRLIEAAGADREELADYSERTVASLTAQAARPELAAALAKLPRGNRDVLLLIAWEGLSYDEVSAALGIPLGTVRSRLHRARLALRQSLAHIDYEEILTNE